MKFLRLSNFVINPRMICFIKSSPVEHRIIFNSVINTGWALAGSGGVSSEAMVIKVTDDNINDDYKRVSSWINENADYKST